jgi:hypothetical protein
MPEIRECVEHLQFIATTAELVAGVSLEQDDPEVGWVSVRKLLDDNGELPDPSRDSDLRYTTSKRRLRCSVQFANPSSGLYVGVPDAKDGWSHQDEGLVGGIDLQIIENREKASNRSLLYYQEHSSYWDEAACFELHVPACVLDSLEDQLTAPNVSLIIGCNVRAWHWYHPGSLERKTFIDAKKSHSAELVEITVRQPLIVDPAGVALTG